MASAAGSLFARTYAGHTGVDPYTTAVSDVYQDLFGEGIFTGKGLYDVDAFMAALDGSRARERAAVARSVRGPARARRARHRRRSRRRLSVERAGARAPPAPLGARRLADPVVAVPVGADARRPRAQPPAARSRAGRSSTTCAAACVAPALRRAVHRRVDGPARTTRSSGRSPALATMSFAGAARGCSRCCAGPRTGAGLRVFLRALGRGPAAPTWRASLLQLTFLAHQAWDMLHAVGRHAGAPGHHASGRLLQWETAAAVAAARQPRSASARFYDAMAASPIIARRRRWCSIVDRPAAGLPAALPILAALGAGAAASPIELSQPAPSSRPELTRRRSRRTLQTVARATWKYFETFVGRRRSLAAARQRAVDPEPRIAHRTSPTNIAMGLLATLSAHDLGFIDADALVDAARSDARPRSSGSSTSRATCSTGTTRRPWRRCCRRYVSTVDSGNSPRALLTLSAALRELAQAPSRRRRRRATAAR